MSLIDEAMDNFIIMNKISVPDGYGGRIVQWEEGATIKGALAFNSSIEAQLAMKQGVTSVYTLVTSKVVRLDYHDVIKRESDGKILRVTSDGDDLVTPASSSLDMRNVTCEEWKLDG